MKRLPRYTTREATLGLQPSTRFVRRGEASRVSRRARIFAGALCGLGVTLFPGLALLAVQLGLVAAWAFLMFSLLSATTRYP